MARERRRNEADGMPERLTRFVPAEWPDPEDDRPEFNDRARAVFTWRRYCKARRAWIQARGGPGSVSYTHLTLPTIYSV